MTVLIDSGAGCLQFEQSKYFFRKNAQQKENTKRKILLGPSSFNSQAAKSSKNGPDFQENHVPVSVCKRFRHKKKSTKSRASKWREWKLQILCYAVYYHYTD